MTHILLIHQAFASLDEPGGTRHHEFARLLAKKGFRVTIVASPVSYLTGQTKAEIPNKTQGDPGSSQVTILRAYTYPALHRSYVHRTFSFISFMISSFIVALRVKDVDLVWGTSPPIFQGITAWLIARIKRAPFLFEVRDLWPAFAEAIGLLRNPLLIHTARWLERFLYQHADMVIVNSPGFIQHVQGRGARRVELISNGSDADMFDPQDRGQEFRRAHKWENRFIALYAGAHGISNDLDILLQAAALLRDRSDILIVLLGDGKEKPRLVEAARNLRLDNICFLPPVSKKEMSHALAAADACIAILKPVPLYATVYPNKVFDYMAAGRPVILAIPGVIKDLLNDAQAGICIQPGDPTALMQAIVYLADHPEEAKRMGKNGRRCVETFFDRPLLADRFANLISEMVNRL